MGGRTGRRRDVTRHRQKTEKFRRKLPGYASRLDLSRDYVNGIKDEEERARALGGDSETETVSLMRTLIRFAATSPCSRLNFLIVTVSRRNFYIVA